jgi:hypothetical protein
MARKPAAEVRFAAFGALLDRHIRAGTRPDPNNREPWTNPEFAKLMPGRDPTVEGAAPNTVANWRRGATRPQAIEPILCALFGPFRSDGGNARSEMREAFDAARALEEADDRIEEGDSSVPPTDWRVRRDGGVPGMVELRFHPPRPGNEPGVPTVYIYATLWIDVAEYEYESRSLIIGLKEAYLCIDSRSWPLRRGSWIGERCPLPGIEPKPSSVRLTPTQDRQLLTGAPLQDEYLGVLENVGDERNGPVTITLSAASRSFHIADAGAVKESGFVSENKDAVLSALIRKGRKIDPQGRIILSESSLVNVKNHDPI